MDKEEANSRLRLSCSISELAKSIQSDFLKYTSSAEFEELRKFVRTGALHYWLSNFLDIIHSRWDREVEPVAIRTGISDFEDSIPDQRIVHQAMSELNRASQDEFWNRQIRSDIHRYIREFGHLNFSVNESTEQQIEPSPQQNNTNLKGHKVVIARTYLPKMAELFLAISVGTLPTYWREPRIVSREVDNILRGKMRFGEENSKSGTLEHFLRTHLHLYIPKNLVENFIDILNSVNIHPRTTPRIIFTANLHVSSDSFLIWAAFCKINGARLLLSQHGGLNGQAFVPTRGEEFEQEFSTEFLHWGWSTTKKSIRIPAQINVWTSQRKQVQRRSELVLITDCTYRLSRKPWQGDVDDANYRMMLLSTVRGIPSDIREQTVVRLHHDHDKYDTDHRIMWKSNFPTVRINDGLTSIGKLRKRARLIVCTTLGTSEIEQFCRSIPTVLRLDPDLHRVRPTCEKLFNEMEKVGLVHYSVQSFTDFLNSNWHEINSWWESEDVQGAIKEYLARFGYLTRFPLVEIRRVLLSTGR